MISQCHRFTFLGFIVSKFVGNSEVGTSADEWEKKRVYFIKSLPAEHQANFEKQWESARRAISVHFVFTSFPPGICMVLLSFAVLLTQLTKILKRDVAHTLYILLKRIAGIPWIRRMAGLAQQFGFDYNAAFHPNQTV